MSSDEKSFSSISFCSFSFEFIEVFEKNCDVLNEKWCFENENNDCEFFNFWIFDFVKFRLRLTSFEFFDWFDSLKFFELFELFDFIFSFSLSIFTKVLNFQRNFDFIENSALVVSLESNFSLRIIEKFL